MTRAFIDFYNSHDVLPVRQNTEDPRFRESRSFLYSRLGVPLRFIHERDVLEFGPGGGFNATATSFYKPREYHFVEGSVLGVKKLREFIQSGKINTDLAVIHETDFLKFSLDKKFDLVIAEACIPGQLNPENFLIHISNFTNKDGVLIITTTSMCSLLPEILRALFGHLIKSFFKSAEDYIIFLESKIDSQLSYLGSNRRSTKDWVIDNIVNPFYRNGAIFTILDATKILSKFELQASVPNFFTNLTWYKNYTFNNAKSVDDLTLFWPRIELFLLDFRIKEVDMINVSINKAKSVVSIVESIYYSVNLILNSKRAGEKERNFFGQIINQLRELAKILPPEFESTKISIIDFIDFLDSTDKLNYKFTSFESWWGRGQQYVAFRRVL